MAHLDGDVFKNPTQFDPDRFLDPAATANLIWPHGVHDAEVSVDGHICPGKDVAVLYGKLLCHGLLTKHDWKLEEPPVWDMHKFSLNVASPMGPLQLKEFTERKL